MNQIIKTEIDGVPVEIEITKMGPATAPELKELENNIEAENKNVDKQVAPSVTDTQVKITKIGADGKASEEDVAKVKAALENSGKTPTALVTDLINSVQSVPDGKNWWSSKVVWINAIAILTAILGYFGITTFKLDPELFEIVFPIVVAIINLYLRKGTNVPLSGKVVPSFVSKK